MGAKSTIIAVALAAASMLAGAACAESYEFDKVTAGDVDSEREPRPRTDGQFLRTVYADLLGRAPGQLEIEVADESDQVLYTVPLDEQELLLLVLEGSGDADAMRSLVVAGLVESEEVSLPSREAVADPAAFVTEQFHAFLGRDPSAYELESFVTAWNEDPAVDPKVVVRAIVGSREYQSQ
jgi:hypothetical protein